MSSVSIWTITMDVWVQKLLLCVADVAELLLLECLMQRHTGLMPSVMAWGAFGYHARYHLFHNPGALNTQPIIRVVWNLRSSFFSNLFPELYLCWTMLVPQSPAFKYGSTKEGFTGTLLSLLSCMTCLASSMACLFPEYIAHWTCLRSHHSAIWSYHSSVTEYD